MEKNINKNSMSYYTEVDGDSTYHIIDRTFSMQYMANLRRKVDEAFQIADSYRFHLSLFERNYFDFYYGSEYFFDRNYYLEQYEACSDAEEYAWSLQRKLNNIEANLANLLSSGRMTIEEATNELGHSKEYINELLNKKENTLHLKTCFSEYNI